MAVRKQPQTFVQEWEIMPALKIGVGAWALSWVWWNWREVVLDFAPWIRPPAPFETLAAFFRLPGTAAFTSLAIGVALLAALFTVQSGRWSNKAQVAILRALTHGSAAMVAFRLFWDFWHWLHLNSGWFQETTFFTGKVAITFLFLSLACTPLVTLFGWSSLNQLKKPLGNWGFGFVFVHLLLFTLDTGVIENQLRLGTALGEAVQKRYALIGLTAFLLLLPLFATSNKWSQRKLKKNWKKLHQLVYVINVLAVTHYIWVWLSKRALTQPIAYALILAFLLFLRLKPIKAWIRDFKKNRKRRSPVQASV